jgi:hypothetical protein
MHGARNNREKLAAALDFAVFVIIILIGSGVAVFAVALSKTALASAMFLLVATIPLLVWGWVLTQLRRYLESGPPVRLRDRAVLREIRPDTVKPRGRAA